MRANANNQAVDVTIVAYRYPSATYYFQIVTPAGRGVGPFEPMLDSLGTLTQAEANAITGKRIRIVTVKASDTIDSACPPDGLFRFPTGPVPDAQRPGGRGAAGARTTGEAGGARLTPSRRPSHMRRAANGPT
ncbi:hypothetical protein ACVOMT_16310 [Sphingomonas panni]